MTASWGSSKSLCSRTGTWVYYGEVNLGLGNFVDIVGQGIQGNMQYNFNDLSLGTTPSCFLTASSNGKVAAGVCSTVGIVILFMSVLQVKDNGFDP
jgi:hypothetical protein